MTVNNIANSAMHMSVGSTKGLKDRSNTSEQQIQQQQDNQIQQQQMQQKRLQKRQTQQQMNEAQNVQQQIQDQQKVQQQVAIALGVGVNIDFTA